MASRATLVVRLAVSDPPLLGDYLCAWWNGRSPAQHATPPSRHPALDALAGRERLADLVGGWADGPVLRRLRRHELYSTADANRAAIDVAQEMAGDASFGETVYGVVRALQPELVVETGVATGITSAYLLAALEDNGAGKLISIDLPPMSMPLNGLVGCAVPQSLRGRWDYRWGAARRLLPRVIRDTSGRLGVFIHDSDHSYKNMRWELELAWSALRPGGCLIADDAHSHAAFEQVAERAGQQPLLIAQPDKGGYTGLLLKPVSGLPRN